MKFFLTIQYIIFVSALVSCEQFVEIDPPRTDLVRSTVFESDETAEAAIVNMYYQMQLFGSFACGGDVSISFLGALSCDDALNTQTFLTDLQAFNDNELIASNPRVLSLWSDLYKVIYKANASIEGLSDASSMTPAVKDRLTGEALFVRAFAHFYLVNLFGDVPLVLTSDYLQNQSIGRTPAAQVYAQIKIDLKQAAALLAQDYSASKEERVRPNSFAAFALLARVHLYLGEWSDAEKQASVVIDNPLYALTSLDNVFIKNNPEAIWQLIPLTGAPEDRASALAYSTLTPSLRAEFHPTDQRSSLWLTDGMANKYRSDGSDMNEYSMILRLAEQYLIRSEARAQLNKLDGSADDINSIRIRAGLDAVEFHAIDEALAEVETQRRLEFFMEWGHRWLDLKRWSKADAVLLPKKSGWSTTDALYPIPESQLLNDPAMRNAQNPGY